MLPTCMNCGTDLIKKNAKKFCSHKCQHEFAHLKFIKDWKAGVVKTTKFGDIPKDIRWYLLDKCGNRCCKCGWQEVNQTTGKVPLTINHVDGNCNNNVESNLEVLCPNCHSLTHNYGALNKGQSKRSWRLGK